MELETFLEDFKRQRDADSALLCRLILDLESLSSDVQLLFQDLVCEHVLT
jgi:hypothetical protein